MSESLWFLKRCPLFSRLTAAECERLEGRSRARSYRKGDVIYVPSDAGESVLLLVSGRVKIVSVLPDGRASTLAVIEPGELFGELALVDDAPRQELAEAALACRVLAIPRGELIAVVDRHPGLALSALRLIGFRLRRVESRLKGLLFRSCRERTVTFLVDYAERYGTGGARSAVLRFSHQDLANLLGTSRETVTLTLGRLKKDGLIELTRGRIALTDWPRLVREARSGPGLVAPEYAKRNDAP